MTDFTQRQLHILEVIFDHAYMELLHSIRMITLNEVVSEEMAETARIYEKLAKEYEGLSNKIDMLKQEIGDEDLR